MSDSLLRKDFFPSDSVITVYWEVPGV